MYMCCIVINRDGGSCLSKIKSSGHHPLSYNKNTRKCCKPNDLPSVKQTRKMNESLSPHSCENVLCHFVSHNIFMERHRFEEINFFCLAGFLLFVEFLIEVQHTSCRFSWTAYRMGCEMKNTICAVNLLHVNKEFIYVALAS